MLFRIYRFTKNDQWGMFNIKVKSKIVELGRDRKKKRAEWKIKNIIKQKQKIAPKTWRRKHGDVRTKNNERKKRKRKMKEVYVMP